ncbi:Protein of unknown function [Cyclobacterium lianum]|uniref:DUF2490 domain-containing protein n=1 Tax=Cyclobacterium lianum TaxID=388280 RepID=A0A1M7PFL3_9BACT|nr:DUF2490 domain-containing protein [Cyclobacterium lianum]SHN15482.1 Protein of unknown function [Cyclobacterium lianum]
MKKVVCILIFILPALVMGQGRVTNFGLFPEFQIGFSAAENLKVTGKIESQHGMLDKTESNEADWGYYHNQTDFQGFLGTSLNPFVAITAGYQYRVEPGRDNSHRSIQQVSFLQRASQYKVGHRVRTDQTFAPGEPIEYRLRYRISFEIPIEGQSLDPGEFFLVFSDEPIYSLQSGESGLENRLVAALGHYSKGKQKFQAGIDYRTDRFFEDDFRQRTWFKFGWYLSL